MQKAKQIFIKGLFLTLAFLMVGIGEVEKVNAEEIKINISEDNELNSKTPNTVKNSSIYITIGKSATYGEEIMRYLGKVDVSSVDKTKSIKEAVIVMDRVSTTWDEYNAEYLLYEIGEDWNSSTTTWNNQPAMSNSTYSGISGVIESYGVIKFDVTDMVKIWTVGVNQNKGFLIKKANEAEISDSEHGLFASSNYSTSGCQTRPYLQVTYYAETDSSITITAPVLNERLAINEKYSFEWEHIALDNNTITTDLYDTDNNFVVNIATTSPNGIFTTVGKEWVVPDSYIGSGYRIKVSSVENPDIYDWSDRFYIYNPNDTTIPAKPTNISVGQNTSSDPVYKLSLDYSTPSDVDYYCVNIYRSTVSGQLGEKVLSCVGKDMKAGANTGYFPYEDLYIKNNSNGTGTVYYTIRAVDTAGNESINTDQYSYSWDNDSDTTTPSPPTNISASFGGDYTSVSIKWTTPNDSDFSHVKVYQSNGRNVLGELLYDNLSNETGKSTGLIFKIENKGLVLGNTYYYTVRSVDTSGNESTNTDQYPVVLIKEDTKSITVISPNGGEKWEMGKAYSIVWHSTGYDKVKIYIECEGYGSKVFMDVPSETMGGSYIYTVPLNWETQNQCKVHISENLGMISPSKNGINYDISDNYFSIVESNTSSMTVISPSSGDDLEIGKQYQIKWNTMGLSSDEKLKIIIYTESKQRSHTIAESVNNTGSYNWTAEFPGLVIQPNQKFYIYIDNSSIFDYSETFYLSEVSIDKSITVISPNSGEELKIGKQHLIRWNTTGDIDQVSVALNKNEEYVKNLFWSVINNGSIAWTPDLSLEVGDDYKITITADSSIIYDESDNYFSITKSSSSTCLPDGTLIKIPGNPKIYVIKNCEKHWIKNAEEFQQGGYQWGNVQEVNIEVINMYVDQITVNLLKGANSSKIYRVVNGKRLWIPTVAAFNAQGLKWDDVQNVSETNVNQYPVVKLVKLAGSPKVYYLTNSGFKKHIITAEVFNSYNNRWEDIIEVSADELNAFGDVQLIKADGDSKVYKLEDGYKRWIKTANAFNRLGLSWTEISPVNNIEISSYPVGANIE